MHMHMGVWTAHVATRVEVAVQPTWLVWPLPYTGSWDWT